jgi:hypothetical protein
LYSHLSQNFHKEKFSASQKVDKSANTSSNLNETMRNKVGAKSVSIVTIKAMLHRIVISSAGVVPLLSKSQ